MKKNILYIISAPSGAGKSTLITNILKNKFFYNIKLSISYTTREIRSGEIDGEDYHFISKKEFKKLIKKNEFLEYAKVFDNYYGTSKVLVNKLLLKNYDVILDIDWQGANQIRKKNKDICSIFILPPSKKVLYHRIKNRGQDTDVVIIKRMKKAIKEMSHYHEYDYLIINDNFSKALFDLKNVFYTAHLSTKQQKVYNYDLINKLLT
ncbi:guanylate kinase [Candidatus Tachikawaea gelatinosa]|uniref:guanylate kinase n=1 Tax=Candidatus Tachikawaea gelatinosa TaxID=1410383 RepID=UPI000596CCB0|nr:guanylate kinase [Candidatus Tachikawaea gelatinosa]